MTTDINQIEQNARDYVLQLQKAARDKAQKEQQQQPVDPSVEASDPKLVEVVSRAASNVAREHPEWAEKPPERNFAQDIFTANK
tara:strand:+ start:6475 stop:6726 length:252 start_codon:yes stop_codon:yes gene_type:complete